MVTHEPKEDSPSFFKVIRYPSAAHLSLPNAFVRRYLNKIPKKPTLITATGDRSWKMEFVKIGEDYCFAHGWEELVKDVGLCLRDVLVFWLIDPLTFVVSFLSENGCEKDVPVNKINTNVDDKDDDDDDVDGECHDDGDNLCFQKEVVGGKSFKYYMSLPIKFVRAAGLEDKKSIKLKDHEGKEWIMGIMVQRYTSIKYGFSAGWAMFRKYHNFADGDILTFVFDKQEGVMNLTQLLRSKRAIKQETSWEEVNRNTRTQSCYGDGNVKVEGECSPTEKHCAGVGGVKVKTEYEPGPDMEVGKRKRESPQLRTCVNVKIEDGWVSETAVGKQNWEMPPPQKSSRGGGVGMESMFQTKRVVYF